MPAACATAVAVTAIALLAAGDPRGGEPYAVATLPAAPTDAAHGGLAASARRPLPQPDAAAADPASLDDLPLDTLPLDTGATGSLGRVPRPAAAAAGGLASPGDAPRPSPPSQPIGAQPMEEAVLSNASPAANGPFDGGTLEHGVKVYRGTGPAAAPPRGPIVIDVSRQLGLPPRRPEPAASAVAGPAPGINAGLQPAPSPAPPAAPLSAPRPALRPDATHPAAGGLAGGAASQATSEVASPRIALLIGNMGLSQPATAAAVADMPAAVTLAFLPYGGTLAADVAAARNKGHELLLQLPMENAGAPLPGPHALRANEGAQALDADLGWLLGRFKGYSGISNLLGAPVTADPAAMAALAGAAAARGLFLAEDGTSRRSVAIEAAARAGVPAVAADVLLDATADAATVQRNLDRLVAIARQKGSAIGVSTGLPEHLDAIRRFAVALAGKNIVLVPVGTLARHSATVATITR